jgi:hypothetical protein
MKSFDHLESIIGQKLVRVANDRLRNNQFCTDVLNLAISAENQKCKVVNFTVMINETSLVAADLKEFYVLGIEDSINNFKNSQMFRSNPDSLQLMIVHYSGNFTVISPFNTLDNVLIDGETMEFEGTGNILPCFADVLVGLGQHIFQHKSVGIDVKLSLMTTCFSQYISSNLLLDGVNDCLSRFRREFGNICPRGLLRLGKVFKQHDYLGMITTWISQVYSRFRYLQKTTHSKMSGNFLVFFMGDILVSHLLVPCHYQHPNFSSPYYQDKYY